MLNYVNKRKLSYFIMCSYFGKISGQLITYSTNYYQTSKLNIIIKLNTNQENGSESVLQAQPK